MIYEEKGHPLHLVSINVNGVLSNDTWSRLLNLAQFLKVDILCLQETNIAIGDTRHPALVATAKFHGSGGPGDLRNGHGRVMD